MDWAVTVLKVGSTYPDLERELKDYDDWIVAGLGLPEDCTRIVDVRSGDPLPHPRGTAAVVVSGAHEMVTDRAEWSVRSGAWLRELVTRSVPLLCICYGHQLLAHVLGGEVGNNPRGWEAGVVSIRRRPAAESDPIFHVLPERFSAYSTHAQSVLGLPEDAVLLASSDRDPHQAFRVGPCAWGVQFHPEFSAEATRHYIVEQREDLEREGQDVRELLAAVRPVDGHRVLTRFGQLVLETLG
jgi:GMP synthase (glutamine-hydrolysing)